MSDPEPPMTSTPAPARRDSSSSALAHSASESDFTSLNGADTPQSDSEPSISPPVELVEAEPEAGIRGEEGTFSHVVAGEYDAREVPEEEKVVHGREVEGLVVGREVDKEFVEPEMVLGTMRKEEFWMLVRRFNKQVFHVREMEGSPPGDLDLSASEHEEYTPEKLRAGLERLYMSVIIGTIAFLKHIVRLRSWNEKKRTSIFCAVYFTAWFLNVILPTLLTVLVVLILYEPSRRILFPPAPLSLISVDNGKLQTPPSGTLGSKDSVTGAPETHQGEAVEQEAFNFVAGIGSIVVSSATGEHPVAKTNEEGDVVGLSGLDRTSISAQAMDTKANSVGLKSTVKTDKSKRPMEAMAWSKARPAMVIIGSVCDVWERLGNALSPTPPFPNTSKYVLAGVLIPGILATLVLNSEFIVKTVSLAFGAVFFGQPGIDRGFVFLNARYPNWKQLLDIRNSILRHVPTNAQLTLTLLRIGEAKNAPLPPPPASDEAPPSVPSTPPSADELPLDVTQSEINAAIAPPSSSSSSNPTPKSKHPARDKLLSFFKSTTKTGVETQLGTDHIRAAAGSQSAKRRLGVLPRSLNPPILPCEFRARYQGRRGYVMITTTATVPCVSFSTHSRHPEHELPDPKALKPMFSIPLKDIVALRKVGGFGWKAKLIVGWAMDRKVADALEIETREGRWTVTAMPGRDECFNRLIAAGGQKWEIY